MKEFIHLSLTQCNVEKVIECCGCEWVTNTSKVHRLLAIYRSPSADFKLFLEKFELVLEAIFSLDSVLWVTGDFNVDVADDTNKNKDNLVNLMSQFGLYSIVNDYKRVTSTSKTRIDNIFVNFNISSRVVDTYMSDHRLVLVPNHSNLTDNVYIQNTTLRKFNKSKIKKFKDLLSEETWLCTYKETNLDKKVDVFFNIIAKNINIDIPLEKKEVYKKKNWVNDEVRTSSQRLNDLNKIQKVHPVLKPIFKERKIQHTVLVNRTKTHFYSNQIETSDNKNKSAWRIIREITNKTNFTNNSHSKNIKLFHGGNQISSPD